jgi:hypothetical protein
MSRLVVHAGTGTIIDASECVLVDTDQFNDHDTALVNDGDDSDVVEIAERCGVAVDTHEQILRAISGALSRHQNDDNMSDGETLDMVCELLDAVGLDPFGGQTNFLTDLRRDAARWNAFTNTPIRSGSAWAKMALPIRKIACASCVHVGNDWDIMVDHRTAAVVPWDVMGDARSFAFVCDKCASGSAVVL